MLMVNNEHSEGTAQPEAPAANLQPTNEGLTNEQLAESKAYGRCALECTIVDMVIDVVYLGLMAFVAARIVDQWLSRWSILQHDWARLAALYLVTMVVHYVISFPLSVYSGFVLEHKYHMSRQSFGRWLWRYLLQNALVFGFGLAMVWGLFAIIWWTEHWWWLVAAAAAFVVTVMLGQLVPVLILPLFYQIEMLDDEELAGRFETLTRHTSLQVEGVYRMKMSRETVKANALLTGLGRTRRVILGDTLLDNFEADEIEVVLAHEIGHHVYHHITKMILLGLVYSASTFFVCDRILAGWVTAQEGAFAYSQVPVYALPMLMFVVTLFSLFLSPLRNAVSRRFERACDRYALRATGNPVAYRSAFTKLARLNKADPNPHPLEVFLLHDHPPVAERLGLADVGDLRPRL